MRVIAGTLGGRQFQSPHGHRTHPMSEKMRGALFGVLGDIAGLTVLDAFAGSGALSFEALSRGAASALLIDNDRSAQAAIGANLAALGLSGRTHLAKAPLASWLQQNPAQQFDLILADPPYDHLSVSSLQQLPNHLSAAGVLVLSWPAPEPVPDFDGLEVITQKNYGDAQLVFFRHIK